VISLAITILVGMFIEGAGIFFIIRARFLDQRSSRYWGGDLDRVQASSVMVIGLMFTIGGGCLIALGVLAWP